MNDPVLTLRSVSKYFPSSDETLKILENVDLTVERATKVAIVGESGCGKSTLLNIVGGLESASAGSIVAGDYRVDELDESSLTRYRGDYLGFVFQFHYLLKDFTALENVMLPAYIAGLSKKEALERARQLLSEVRLEGRMGHYPSQMSGGERQRAAVARALVNDPSLVLADEPTGNLDPANAETVKDLLFSVVSKRGKTLIVVTHDREMAALADRRYRLVGARLVEE
jgi:lipoprotein-releasing system ATP-binding protein